jgi:hypothetical protein
MHTSLGQTNYGRTHSGKKNTLKKGKPKGKTVAMSLDECREIQSRLRRIGGSSNSIENPQNQKIAVQVIQKSVKNIVVLLVINLQISTTAHSNRDLREASITLIQRSSV